MMKQLIFLTLCLLGIPVNSMQPQENRHGNNPSIERNNEQLLISAAIEIIGKKFPKGNESVPKILILRKNGTTEQLLLKKSEPAPKIKLLLLDHVIGSGSIDERELIAIMHYASSAFLNFCKTKNAYRSACDDGDLSSARLRLPVAKYLMEKASRIPHMVKQKNIWETIKKNLPKIDVSFFDVFFTPRRIRRVDLNEKHPLSKGKIKRLSSIQKKRLMENLKNIAEEHKTFEKIYNQLLHPSIYQQKPTNDFFDVIIHTAND